jgi:hypothetical protein
MLHPARFVLLLPHHQHPLLQQLEQQLLLGRRP